MRYFCCPACSKVEAVMPNYAGPMECDCTVKFTFYTKMGEIPGDDPRVKRFLSKIVQEVATTLEAYNKAMEHPISEWGKTFPEFLESVAALLDRIEKREDWLDRSADSLRKHAVLLKKAMILASGQNFIIDVCMTCKTEFDAKPGKAVNGLNLNHGYCPPCAVKAEKEFGLAPKEGA